MAEVSTNNIWPYYAAQNSSTAKERAKDQSMGKDDFMKILVAQLKHQDPMKPLEDKEFIAQMAQFSSIEQIQNMSKNMEMMRQSLGISSDLIGKHVSWATQAGLSDEMEIQSGMVDSIWFKDGIQMIQSGAATIPLDDIIEVWIENAKDSGAEDSAEENDEVNSTESMDTNTIPGEQADE